MKGQIDQRPLGHGHGFAVYGDAVTAGIGRSAQLYPLAVHLYTSLANPFIRSPPGCQPCLLQNTLDAHLHLSLNLEHDLHFYRCI